VNTKDRQHLSQLAALGCIACRLDGHYETPAEIHHIRTGMGMGQRNSHQKAIPLCPAHHRGTAGKAVPSVHGTPKAFLFRYGTELDLLAEVNRLLEGRKTA
jgi:hypothetical protein